MHRSLSLLFIFDLLFTTVQCKLLDESSKTKLLLESRYIVNILIINYHVFWSNKLHNYLKIIEKSSKQLIYKSLDQLNFNNSMQIWNEIVKL